jgi:hypothetical protein
MARFSVHSTILLLGLSAWSFASDAQESEIDITAFGDTGFIAGNKLLGNDNNHLIGPHLKGLEPLRSRDINLINLEATLATQCAKVAEKTFSFVMTPDALAEYLKWGMNFIGLANNHSTDCVDPWPYGQIEGIVRSLQLRFPDTRFHGVARNAAKLVKFPAARTVRGLSVGMVSIKGWDNGAWTPLGNLANRKKVFAKLQSMPFDLRILSLHGGVESTRQPGLVVADVAREFINNYDGDVVFAHHPHVMQGVEVMKKKNGRTAIIFYSLGNNLHNGLSMAGDGLVAKVFAGKSGINPDRMYLFPLKYASFNPRPYKQHEVAAAIAEVEASNKLIPRGRASGGRVSVRLEQVAEPAVGARILVVP